MKVDNKPKLSKGFEGEQFIHIPPKLCANYLEHSLFTKLYILSAGYYPNARLHYYERTHSEAQFYVLLYCVKGEGFAIVDGRKFMVKANEVIIIPSGKSHSYGSSVDNPWTIYWCHYNGLEADRISQMAYCPMSIKPKNDSRIQDRIILFKEIINVLSFNTNYDAFEYANSCLIHLLSTLRYIKTYRNASFDKFNDCSLSQKAVHYMKESVDKNISLNDIANYCNYSKSRFIALFKSDMGITPIEYFNKLKVDLACQYIRQSDIKANQLCYKIGIENPVYFSRMFKKYTGFTITEYRNKYCDS